MRIVLLLLAVGYFSAASLFLVLRYVALPRVAQWRPEIEQVLSEAVGLPVAIDAVDADWDGLRPRLHLAGLRLRDSQGRDALRLEKVDASVGWSSLYFWRLRLHTLVFEHPTLDIRRASDGHIEVAGIALQGGGGRSRLADWVMDQRNVVIRDARLRWSDAQRGAPLLSLERVRLRLENDGRRHRFGLTADAPMLGAAGLDLRGDFRDAGLLPLQDESGKLYLGLDQADLAVWQQWVDYPFDLSKGTGSVHLWLNLAHGQLQHIAADLAVRDARARFAPDLPLLELSAITGHLDAERAPGRWVFAGRDLTIASAQGVQHLPADFRFEHHEGVGTVTATNTFSASRFDLAALAGIAAHLPFPSAWLARLHALTPQGEVERLNLAWQEGSRSDPAHYRLEARFRRFSVQAAGALPGLSGAAGEIKGDETGGQFSVNVDNGSIVLPKVFEDPVLPLTAALRGSWRMDKGLATVQLDEARFHNADLDGQASGRYVMEAEGPGSIDLQASLGHAQATRIWRYIPLSVGVDVRNWLKQSLQRGVAEDAHLSLRGKLAHFPFENDPAGTFHITYRVRGVHMDYAPRWPGIDGIDGDMVFDRARMEIRATQGQISGTRITRALAVVPDLNRADLGVEGEVVGPTAEFLRFVNASPVARSVGHLTRSVQAQGQGVLALRLQIPLQDAANTAVKGEYRFDHNRIKLLPFLPDLLEAGGRFGFTERSFTVTGVDAQFLGAPTHINGSTRADGTVDIEARATVPVRNLAVFHPSPLWDHLSGEIAVVTRLAMKGREVSLGIESPLQGLSSSLPEPFNKSVNVRTPLKLDWRWRPDGEGLQQTVAVDLGAVAHTRLVLNEGSNGVQGLRGAITLGGGDGGALPEHGVHLRGEVANLDVDAWRRLVEDGGGGGEGPPVTALDLRVGELRLAGYRFQNQGLRAEQVASRWDLRLAGAEANGELHWEGAGSGQLRGHLKRLSLIPAAGGGAPRKTTAAAPEPVRMAKSLPALDISVDTLAYAGHELGAFALRGAPAADVPANWKLERLALENKEGALHAQGEYRTEGGNRTHLSFAMDSPDVGGLLGRLGYVGTVHKGVAKIEGVLDWAGAPDQFALTALSGAFKLDASAGQFVKLDPGMGRLLGVLNLQALPRRISLDFRDVFSEGFAFDTISGSMKINRGVIQTEDLEIVGPAAKVFMHGTVDLGAETQNLTVRVQPTLSETVAIGLALGPVVGALNPAVGLMTYLAQKMMRDPVEKFFSYEYEVVGNWADPQVRKLPGTFSVGEPPRR